VSEAIYPNRLAQSFPFTPMLVTDEQSESWKR
jgi:hypothetical protein